MYLLDANSLITPKNSYYRFHVVPGFWSFLEQEIIFNKVLSIDVIQRELFARKDELIQWAEDHPDLFRAIDKETVDIYRELCMWVGNSKAPEYTANAIQQFQVNPNDGLLVAYAIEKKLTVVTFEKSGGTGSPQGKVKIPDVCSAFDVECITLFEMVEALGMCLN